MQVIGTGSQYVYVYYLKQYQKQRDTYYWPCKIGMSKIDPIQRVAQQIKTALPEYPEIGLVIKTDDAYLLEQALHAILKLKHRQVAGPGNEWFNTTPDEVQTLVKLLRAA